MEQYNVFRIFTGKNVLRWKRNPVDFRGGIFKGIFLEGQCNGKYPDYALTSADLVTAWLLLSHNAFSRQVVKIMFFLHMYLK